MPGKCLRVTFSEAVYKEQLQQLETITVGDVPVKIVGGGPRPQNFIIYQFPFEGDDSLVESTLQQFGEVHFVAKQKYADPHCLYRCADSENETN